MAATSSIMRRRRITLGLIAGGAAAVTIGVFVSLGYGWGLIVLGLKTVVLGFLLYPDA